MTLCAPSQNLGVFTAGEKPAPLEYQFLDSNNVPIDISGPGFSAKFVWREAWGVSVEAVAAITDAVNGKVTYTWTGPEMAVPGSYRGQFWIGNLTNLWASEVIRWTVSAAVGPAPAI